MKVVIKVLTVVLILAFVLAVYLGFKIRSDNMNTMSADSNSLDSSENIEEYERIMSRDLSVNYPASYLELISYYSDMIKFLYGGTATEEQISKMIEKQRQLYASEILITNTYDEQLAYALEDIEERTQNGNRIFDFEILDIYETNLKNSMVEIRAIYRSTKMSNSDMQYYLIKENGLWKIISFKPTGDISIIE